MILEIYTILIFICIIFIAIGYFLKGKADIFKFSGFVVLFILGLMLVPYNPFGSVEYNSGSSVVVAGTTYNITDNYTTFENLRLGVILATLGGLGFASAFMTRQEEDEYE